MTGREDAHDPTLAEPAPEFSRPVAVDTLGPGRTEIVIDASPDERVALANRFGLVALDKLTATVGVRPVARGSVRVEGKVVADVVQSCVVTLDPVPAHVEEAFAVTFAPPSRNETHAEVVVSLEDDDPEPLVGGAIDIGEVAAEHLALGLDPFPRLPGASFVAPPDPAEMAPASPFAELARLRPDDRRE